MLLLSPSLYFSCRDKLAKDLMEKRSRSSTSSCFRPTASYESLRSVSSSSSQTRSETQDKGLYSSLTRRLHPTQHNGESDTDMEVDEGPQWVDPMMDECGEWMASPSLVLDLPHSCKCKTRSICPEFLQKHFIHVRTPEEPCPVVALLSAYLGSADAYAQSRDALSRPAAKLERAKAEYNWTLSRQNRKLWSPRLEEQLSAAQSKIVAAEEEWQSLSKRRWDKARRLVNNCRF